jgi:hypothetical protein
MRKIIFSLLVFAALTGLSACSSEREELKSPCVGIDGSPCEKRNPKYNAA